MILQTLGDFLVPAMVALIVGLVLAGVALFAPDRFGGSLWRWLAVASFAIAGGSTVACLVILLGQVRDLTAPAEGSPPPAAVDCESIELDGSEEQLQARLECEGVTVIGPCQLDAHDREAFKRMGVEPPECEL